MGKAGIWYDPSSPETVSSETPVATFVAVILAPRMTDPLGSVTTPMIRPVAFCAAAPNVTRNAVASNAAQRRNEERLFM
jgi:hypothetical protein